MFTSEDLFDLEMKHIFEGNWIYLAHESQIGKVNDYYTTKIGRQSIFITRNKDNQLNAFINACAPPRCDAGPASSMATRRPTPARSMAGPSTTPASCSRSRIPEGTGYPDTFNCDGSHELKKIARFESYKGFLFGSLNRRCPAAGRIPRRIEARSST